MKIYFLSSQRCALYINGAYFGVTDGFERSARIALQDGVFVQFVPQNKQPIGFFLTEDIRFSPPEHCEVYLLQDGVAIYAKHFPPTDCTLRPLRQNRFGDTLVTVYYQGELHLSINTPTDVFVAALPPAFEDCKVEKQGELLFLSTDEMLAVYTCKAERLLCERVQSFSVDGDELTAVLLLSDCLGRTAECTWKLAENTLVRTKCVLRQARANTGEADNAAIRNELLPFAFFESVLLGADHAEMLCAELADKADKIVGFLGDFVAVSPTREANTVAVIRQKKERLFEADYYAVSLQDGKIADICKR